MQTPTDYLRFEIVHDDPIEVTTFGTSISAMAAAFTQFARQHAKRKQLRRDDFNLYIATIQSGSIITFFVERLHQIASANVLLEFATYIIQIIDSLSGKKEASDDSPRPSKKLLKEMKRFVALARENRTTVIHLTFNNNNYGPQVGTSVSYDDAKRIIDAINNNLNGNMNALAVQETSRPLLRNSERLAGSTGSFKKVEFQWKRTKQRDGAISFHGRIRSLNDLPLPVSFSTGRIENEMVELMEENPLKTKYIVDVNVEYLNGNVVAYTLTKVRGIADNKKLKN